MSLLFCNAIDYSVSRIQPLVDLFSGCATVCGVDEFREVDPVIFRYPGSSTLGGSCDRDWLYQPGLNHADSKPLIIRRFKMERILQPQEHFN